jgi:hypothetical protein
MPASAAGDVRVHRAGERGGVPVTDAEGEDGSVAGGDRLAADLDVRQRHAIAPRWERVSGSAAPPRPCRRRRVGRRSPAGRELLGVLQPCDGASAIMLALFLCPATRKSWARAATSLGVISPVLTRSDICVNRSSPGFASLVHQAADAVKHSRFRAPTPARSWVPAALLYGLALPAQAKSSQIRSASACQGTPSRTL